MSESQSEKKPSRFMSAVKARWSRLERWLLDGSEVTASPRDESFVVTLGRGSGTQAVASSHQLVRTLAPVGVRLVGPDVAHPLRFGELKIVPPDVTHPNFIYWDKDSTSCPKTV